MHVAASAFIKRQSCAPEMPDIQRSETTAAGGDSSARFAPMSGSATSSTT